MEPIDEMYRKRRNLFINLAGCTNDLSEILRALSTEGPDIQGDCEALADAISYIKQAVACLKDVGSPPV